MRDLIKYDSFEAKGISKIVMQFSRQSLGISKRNFADIFNQQSFAVSKLSALQLGYAT